MSDPDLRAQFDHLKRQDALSARPFAAQWEEARRHATRRRPMPRLAAIAAALVLVAIASFLIHDRTPRPSAVAAITQWQSPTASLLRTPGSQLFTTTPRFGEPIIPSFQELSNR